MPHTHATLRRRSTTRARGPRVRWPGATVEVGPYRVHALSTGSGAETVVLLHGLSGSGRWWARNLPAFARRYRVAVPDVVGFGRSRGPGRLPDLEGLAAILARWLDTLGPGRVHLVGHSMGGQLAIHLAAGFPDRVGRLVLCDAAGIPRRRGARELLRFARGVAPPSRWGDPRFLPVIVGDALTAGPRSILRALAHIVRDDVRPLLPRIQAPTLVLWGANDTVVPLEHGREMRRSIPGARLLVLPHAAHNPMVDRPAAFNRAVLRFLRGGVVGE
ncbi:MAG: dihydrolipoamide acetyltransferase-like protein [Gemmatimonadetes bacterium]|nr:dihydrolipoamide acetyltransferase-like protein [Gemmatimonadota bacterium]